MDITPEAQSVLGCCLIVVVLVALAIVVVFVLQDVEYEVKRDYLEQRLEKTTNPRRVTRTVKMLDELKRAHGRDEE